jgi:outer membrane biosynthesis protein TonB
MQNGLAEPKTNARRRIWRAFFLSALLHWLVLHLLSAGWVPGSGVAVFLAPGLLPALEVGLPDPSAAQAASTPVTAPEVQLEEELAEPPEVVAIQPESTPPVPASPPPPASPQLPPAPPQLPGDGKAQSDYLPAEALAEPPVPVEVPDLAIPTYPGPTEGRIVIEVQINENGRVDQIKTIESNVPGPFLFEVFRAFKSAQYRSGRILGQPVKSSLRIEVSYRRDAPTAGAVSVRESSGPR